MCVHVCVYVEAVLNDASQDYSAGLLANLSSKYSCFTDTDAPTRPGPDVAARWRKPLRHLWANIMPQPNDHMSGCGEWVHIYPRLKRQK